LAHDLLRHDNVAQQGAADMPGLVSRSLVFAALAVSLSGCIGELDPGSPPGDEKPIDDYLASLSALPAEAPALNEGVAGPAMAEGDYSCTTQNYAETRQYDQIVAFSANSESLWPGAILRGDSLYSGLFTQLVFERKPLTFSISLENLAGRKSMQMAAPSLSSFREGLGQVLAAATTGATAANLHSEIDQVHSDKQLSVALGAGVSWPGAIAKVSASFNFDHHEVRSRYVVKYMQSYYTVDVDQPPSPAAFFGPSVTVDELRDKTGPGNPPVYVSSITYGRMVVFTFESEYSADELGAALDFVYRGGVEVSGNVSVKYRDIISKSKITAYILGGSGGQAAQTIDSYDALIAFIKGGGDYSKDSPGAPIAYKLAYLKDNSPARMSFTQSYTVKDCVRVSQKVQVILKSITVEDAGGDPGGELELYGTVQATAKDSAMLFDKNQDNWVRIEGGRSWPVMGVVSEGIINVVPKPGESITLDASLRESDTIGSNQIGVEKVVLPFDTGWRRDIDVRMTGDGTRVTLTFHLEPI
jgi:thiol-activated cytolysin